MSAPNPIHTNKLIKETSPYLLQHAHNPVEWYPWGEEALQKAKEENKVLLVSIGYAACHWCHVMERESFEDEATATLMNELFINVKIDREERPDLDHIYMEAVQAMTGSGGWPLNVFLTPEQKPFYGGTYFPPVPAHGRSSWKDVLLSIADSWQRRRDEIEEQADKLLNHISKAAPFISNQAALPISQDDLIKKTELFAIKDALMVAGDSKDGGFGGAPKFLQTQSIKFLLQHYHYFQNEDALAQAELSLEKMLLGGIYDQLGGGISRYSTDTHWLVPHFEKMLYDNALLLEVVAQAYNITKKPIYKYYLRHTFQFLIKEMKADTGGYFAALDADSEGIEGKFYLWEQEELETLLGEDATAFIDHFNVKKEGNVPVEQPYWKGRNVLHASSFPVEKELLIFEKNIEQLYDVRSQRIPPATDDKIIMGWNCLLITAFCSCYNATGEEHYREEAILLASDISRLLLISDYDFHHSYAKGIAKHSAYLDDLVYYTQALLSLQEITNDFSYLEKAKSVTEYIFQNFYDESDGYFFFSSSKQKDIVVRKKEFYDSAITAANAVHAENLHKLAAYYKIDGWGSIAISMLMKIKEATVKYPTSFATWAVLAQNISFGLNEVAVVGLGYNNLLLNISKIYTPFKIIMGAETPNDEWELLRYTEAIKLTYIYVCRSQLCFKPTIHITEFAELLLSTN